MPLENYTKAELKKIVDIYNIGVEESSLKKKKKDLIKDMQGVKKNYNYTEIDKKLNKKVTTTSEPKKKKNPKKEKLEKKETTTAEPKAKEKESKKYRESLGKKVKDMNDAEKKKYQALVTKESRTKAKESKK